jgi:hypothetical protein
LKIKFSLNKKSNLYNFLTLAKALPPQENVVVLPAQNDNNVLDKEGVAKPSRRRILQQTISPDLFGYSNFPLMASIGVVLVLAFFVYRIFFSKKRGGKSLMRKGNRSKLYFND